MKTFSHTEFNQHYILHCKHLKLKGLQPKTIDAYSRAIRRIGEFFDYDIVSLSSDQLVDYFHSLLERFKSLVYWWMVELKSIRMSLWHIGRLPVMVS